MRFPIEVLKQCCFLAGPTAVGKSALSLRLADRLNAEIISLDSMAIYRGMDIGTAKPEPEDQARVPHHLIDIIDPHDEYSAAQFLADALNVCRNLLEHGRIPLFVGGTGLYLRAVLRGVFSGPPADWDFRREVEDEAKRQGPEWLWRRLLAVDPVSAKRLHPHDERRLIRALEIHRLTGLAASVQQMEAPLPAQDRPSCVVWLHPPRDWLYDRINQRVDRMFDRGLVEETRQLLARNPPPGRTSRQALGYREVIDLLEGRLASFDLAKTLVKTGTRQFAKRQHTWFRSLEECREIPIDGTEPADQLAERIARIAETSPT